MNDATPQMHVLEEPSPEPLAAQTTTVVTPQPIKEHTMSVKTILSDIGAGLKKFFGAAVVVAQDAEPFIDVIFPGIAPLYNETVEAAAAAEAAAVAAGQQSGTGAQKLAMVTASIEASFQAYWTSLGNKTPAPLTTIENYVNAVVATLNAIPSLQS